MQNIMAVYLMKCGEYFKVGVSKNPKSRLSSIQTSNPLSVELIGYRNFTDDYKQEKKIHKKISNCHFNGEWFLLDNISLNYVLKSLRIKKLKEIDLISNKKRNDLILRKNLRIKIKKLKKSQRFYDDHFSNYIYYINENSRLTSEIEELKNNKKNSYGKRITLF